MTALSVIRWEEPPPAPRRRAEQVVTPQLLQDLRSRPGEWALLANSDAVTVARKTKALRRNLARRADAWRYEVRQRAERDRGQLYARYVAGVSR